MTRWWTVSQAQAGKGGRRRPLTLWRMNSWLRMSGPLLDPQNRLSFVPSKVPQRCFVPPPPLATLVADHLILVAIIAQRVRWQECGAPRIFAGERSRSGVPGSRESGHHKRSSPEVVVDGLPLFLGAQPSTRQCCLQSGATGSWRRSTVVPSWWFWAARWGRWSEESRQFLASQGRSEPKLIKKSTMFCWFRWWCTLVACTAARASLSLLERKCCAVADGSTPPTAEVVADHFQDVD